MQLIAIKPVFGSNEEYHLWFRTKRGVISRTLVKNIENLRTTLFTATHGGGAELYPTSMTPDEVTGILKREENYNNLGPLRQRGVY